MNYKQMLDALDLLDRQVKLLQEQQDLLNSRIKLLEQESRQVLHFPVIGPPNPPAPPWQVTCQTNLQDAFR